MLCMYAKFDCLSVYVFLYDCMNVSIVTNNYANNINLLIFY